MLEGKGVCVGACVVVVAAAVRRGAAEVGWDAVC